MKNVVKWYCFLVPIGHTYSGKKLAEEMLNVYSMKNKVNRYVHNFIEKNVVSVTRTPFGCNIVFNS